MYPECIVKKDIVKKDTPTEPNVSCCISMYLDVTCILMNTCKIHAGYMQDTSGYVLYRNPPPICIGNPPSPELSVPEPLELTA